MCGRVRDPDFEEVSELRIKPFRDERSGAPRRHNVPPSQPLAVMMLENGERVLRDMRWGFVPAWAKDAKGGFANARADGIDTKPAFRGAWAAGRRCLVITGGFYEWRRVGKDKQPYFVSMSYGGPLVLAGLWELWRGVRSFAVITTDANDLIADIHDRMPVILSEDQWLAWLGETSISSDEAKAMLNPCSSAQLAMWPVDRSVNSVQNSVLASRI